MNYVVNGVVISDDINSILTRVQVENKYGKLKQYEIKTDEVKVTCPFHSDGKEEHPSSSLNLKDNGVPYLYFHCFACGKACNFSEFIAACFNSSLEWANDWLVENFGVGTVAENDDKIEVEPIKVEKKEHRKYMDEKVLEGMTDYHPYMSKRKLTTQVIKMFGIKYDPKTKTIVFPVRDIKHRLLFLTRRSVTGKSFHIDRGMDKRDLFGIDHIDFNKPVYLVESQINCLTLWSWGYQALCLYGCGCTREQIAVLNNLPIRHYILALDNDAAGIKGTMRLCTFLNRRKIVDVVCFDDSRDVNDREQKDFEGLPMVDRKEFMKELTSEGKSV